MSTTFIFPSTPEQRVQKIRENLTYARSKALPLANRQSLVVCAIVDAKALGRDDLLEQARAVEAELAEESA